jgi:hypothetical protein
MKDHVVILRIMVMTMAIPVAGFDMYLHVPPYYLRLANGNNRISEIGANITIGSTGVNHLESPTFIGDHLLPHQPLPPLHHFFLGKSYPLPCSHGQKKS